ncbi:MAG: DUF6867 family protein [Pseudomonadota bacterium]
MIELLGTDWIVFLIVTLILGGGAAFLTGQAMANRWRPTWMVIGYSLLLGCADRFAVYALADGALWLITGYVIDTVILTVVALIAYRMNKARNMVEQYPWIYERNGLFGWRELPKSAQVE